MEYVLDKRGGEFRDSCVFCQLADQPGDTSVPLLIARSSHTFAMLNRYPYTYGHVMIVPYQHVSSQEDMSTAALTDMMAMTNRVMRVVRNLANPAGFNIGANIGEAAGAGIAAHFHFHVVPRWPGDANFMVTVGGTQTVPDTLSNILERMQAIWSEIYDSTAD